MILVDAIELLLEGLGGEHVVAAFDPDGLSDTAGETVGDAFLLLIDLPLVPDEASDSKDDNDEENNTSDETTTGRGIGLVGRGVTEGIDLGESVLEILAGVVGSLDGVVGDAVLLHGDGELSLGVSGILCGLVGSDPGIHAGLGELHVVNLGKRIVLVGEVVGEDVLLTGGTHLELLLVDEVVGLNVGNAVVAALEIDAISRDGSGLAGSGGKAAGADDKSDTAILLLSGGTETLGVQDETVLAALAVSKNVRGAGGDRKAAELVRGRGEDEVGVLVVLGLVDGNVLEDTDVGLGVGHLSRDLFGGEALTDGVAKAVDGEVGAVPVASKVVPYGGIDTKVGGGGGISTGIIGAVSGPHLLALGRLGVEGLFRRGGLDEVIDGGLFGRLVGEGGIGSTVATVGDGTALERLGRTRSGGLGKQSGGLIGGELLGDSLVSAGVGVLVAVDEVEQTGHLRGGDLHGSVEEVPVDNLGAGRGGKTALVGVGTVHGEFIAVVHVVKVAINVWGRSGDRGRAEVGLGVVGEGAALGPELSLEVLLGKHAGASADLALGKLAGTSAGLLHDGIGILGIDHGGLVLHGRFLDRAALGEGGGPLGGALVGSLGSDGLPTTDVVLEDGVLGPDGDHGAPNGGGRGDGRLDHVDGVELGVEVLAADAAGCWKEQ